MKVVVQHVNVRSSDELDSAIEEHILGLQPMIDIEEARVRLECAWQESPAYCVRIHLVTPGPDLQAEERDHTIQAAMKKTMDALGRQIELKARKRRSSSSAGTIRSPLTPLRAGRNSRA